MAAGAEFIAPDSYVLAAAWNKDGAAGYKSAKPGRWRTRRLRAWYVGAFGLGIALGTAVGMLLEALRQGALP
jgi:hypothetical protein